MQLYTGLPIITNKISAQEQQGIPHHLLGCVGLQEHTWVVGTFVKNALEVMDGIRQRGKVPILVGGTHYYTLNLLFRGFMVEESESNDEKAEDIQQRWPFLQQPTPILLEELKKVDPAMAERWHPNNRRKIQRSLEIFFSTGRAAGEIYAEQRRRKQQLANARGDSDPNDGPSMRFPTLLLWPHSDPNELRPRLECRVDSMVEQGMLSEVRALDAFRKQQARCGQAVDETRGIWASIGYKEFKDYIQALEQPDVSEHELEEQRAIALVKTKIATCQYAKRQFRWIRTKLFDALAETNCRNSLFPLPALSPATFEQDVVDPALDLTRTFLSASSSLPDPATRSDTTADLLLALKNYDAASKQERWTRHCCEACGVTCVTELEWSAHVKSKMHRKRASKHSRLEKEREVSAPQSDDVTDLALRSSGETSLAASGALDGCDQGFMSTS